MDHVQAEALIDGAWTPLTLLWIDGGPTVITYRRHYPDIEPYRYVGLEEWISQQIQYALPKEV